MFLLISSVLVEEFRAKEFIIESMYFLLNQPVMSSMVEYDTLRFLFGATNNEPEKKVRLGNKIYNILTFNKSTFLCTVIHRETTKQRARR